MQSRRKFKVSSSPVVDVNLLLEWISSCSLPNKFKLPAGRLVKLTAKLGSVHQFSYMESMIGENRQFVTENELVEFEKEVTG